MRLTIIAGANGSGKRHSRSLLLSLVELSLSMLMMNLKKSPILPMVN